MRETRWSGVQVPPGPLLRGADATDRDGAHLLETDGDPESLLDRDRADLRSLREHLLDPLDVGFDAPPWVALHLFGREDPRAVIQNFDDEPVTTTLSVEWDLDPRLPLPADAHVTAERGEATSEEGATDEGATVELGPRSLVVL